METKKQKTPQEVRLQNEIVSALRKQLPNVVNPPFWSKRAPIDEVVLYVKSLEREYVQLFVQAQKVVGADDVAQVVSVSNTEIEYHPNSDNTPEAALTDKT